MRCSWLDIRAFINRQIGTEQRPPWPVYAVVRANIDIGATRITDQHGLHDELCVSTVTTACATGRSVAWRRRGENRDGRNPVRARHESWSPHNGETEVLIEPTGLRPNHSMSLLATNR
jgi:hypothetical protein